MATDGTRFFLWEFDKSVILVYNMLLRDRALQQTDRIEFVFRLPSMIPNRLINQMKRGF
jgi:hypothetical protein